MNIGKKQPVYPSAPVKGSGLRSCEAGHRPRKEGLVESLKNKLDAYFLCPVIARGEILARD